MQTLPFLKYSYFKIEIKNPGLKSWVGQRLMPYRGSNIISIHITFVPCQSDKLSLTCAYSQIRDHRSRSYGGFNLILIIIPFVSYQSDHIFLIYENRWISTLKILGQVNRDQSSMSYMNMAESVLLETGHPHTKTSADPTLSLHYRGNLTSVVAFLICA